MAYLIPSDKGTHYVLLSVLALVLLPLGWLASAGVCLAVAIGREVYGRWKRGVPMTKWDWIESAQDIGAGMAGCAVVLAAVFVWA